MRLRRLRALALLALAAGAARTAEAQSYRGWLGTSVQAVQIRPLGLDTVPRADVVVGADGRATYQGVAASCRPTTCTIFAPAERETTLAATQDLSFTAWGLGVQGLSFTGFLRGRARAGGDVVWPRSDDEIDAVLAYAQLVRGSVRLRAGRQEIRSGLGFPAFDGLSGSYAWERVQVEGYAGRSLARGLREPANEALKGLESFLIDKSAYLLGGSMQARFYGTSLVGRYQREILSDRSGLVSERASFDVNSAMPGMSVRAGLDYDFGFEQLGKAHVTLARPIDEGRWLAEISGSRYVPYFDLSTIWGFFRPVSYHELRGGLAWSPSPRLGARVSGGRRWYGETATTVVLEPGLAHGWRTDASVRWSATDGLDLDAAYHLDFGPGSFRSAADAAARYRRSERLGVTASLTTFQQIEELRIGDGRAFGGGLSFDLETSARTLLTGGFFVVRHRDGGTPSTTPWSQSRLWTALRVELGEDPGLRARRQR